MTLTNRRIIKRLFFIWILSLAAHVGMAQAIQPVVLECVSENPSQSNITLTWTQAANAPCGNFIGYSIYECTSPLGPFVYDTTITSQTATSWVDVNITGSTTWYYYIVDSFSCPGATFPTSDTVNNKNPATPVLVSISVTPNGQIVFNWLPSTSPQTKYYVTEFDPPNGGQPTPLDTIYGRFNTTFVDSSINPYLGSTSFTVFAGDSCSTNQTSGYNTYPLSTIFLTYSPAHCDPSIPIAWTKYNFMPGGLGGYELFVSRNDSAYVPLVTFDSTTLSYTYANFNDGDSIQMYIQAFSADSADSAITATSEYLRFTAHVIKPPAYVYITELSVDTTNNSVDLTWIVDNTTKIEEYETFNSQDGINFFPITNALNGVQQVPIPVTQFASNADSTVTPQYYPYWYQIEAYDSCLTSTFSPPGEIISLQGTLSDYYQITLTWNKFVLYGANVLRYDLYRDYGNGMQFDKSFDSSTTTYIDSVFQFLSNPGAFCYVIKATYVINLPMANNYSATDSSFSNIACVDHRPIIYIPNAFVVGGNVSDDAVFKPKIIFGAPSDYSMTIWDRYGGKIFETHDPDGSWDGTDGGHPVEQGGYAYLIQFTALDGTPIERKGIVLCIRK